MTLFESRIDISDMQLTALSFSPSMIFKVWSGSQVIHARLVDARDF
jgi:hypothetical protein